MPKSEDPIDVINKLIEERGVSREQFSRLVGISDRHLGRILKGKQKIGLEVANKLSAYSGISASVFLSVEHPTPGLALVPVFDRLPTAEEAGIASCVEELGPITELEQQALHEAFQSEQRDSGPMSIAYASTWFPRELRKIRNRAKGKPAHASDTHERVARLSKTAESALTYKPRKRPKNT